MRLKSSVVSCTILMYCVHVFVSATNTEILVERWHQSGRVTEDVVNGVLFVMVLLTSGVYCRGISVE
jgi:hypothetical protein